jgi:hypothetical protein
MGLVEGLVLSGSVSSSGPTSLGCLLAWTLVLAPCLFFSPLLGCLLLIKFGKVSSSEHCYSQSDEISLKHRRILFLKKSLHICYIAKFCQFFSLVITTLDTTQN